jgi:hypothetical protein
VNVAASPIGVMGYNVRNSSGAIQQGYLLSYTPGGTIISTAGTTGTISPDVSYVHVMTLQDNRAATWIDVPIYGYSGQAISISVASKCSSANLSSYGAGGWTTSAIAPHIAICDPNVGWSISGADELATLNFTITDTSWHGYAALSYTPTATGPLKLRLMGQGGNTSGNATATITVGYSIANPPTVLLSGSSSGISSGTLNLAGVTSLISTSGSSYSGTLTNAGSNDVWNGFLVGSGSGILSVTGSQLVYGNTVHGVTGTAPKGAQNWGLLSGGAMSVLPLVGHISTEAAVGIIVMLVFYMLLKKHLPKPEKPVRTWKEWYAALRKPAMTLDEMTTLVRQRNAGILRPQDIEGTLSWYEARQKIKIEEPT